VYRCIRGLYVRREREKLGEDTCRVAFGVSTNSVRTPAAAGWLSVRTPTGWFGDLMKRHWEQKKMKKNLPPPSQPKRKKHEAP
jgi:hypothetical protein